MALKKPKPPKKPRKPRAPKKASPAGGSGAGSGGAETDRNEKGQFVKGNAHQFKPGESGNPGGSSQKQMLSMAYKAVLGEQMPKSLKDYIAERIMKGVTVAEIMGWAMAREVMDGNVSAAAEIRKATEGDKTTTIGVDLTRLTDDQVQRIANGEDPAIVLGAAPGDGGAGTAPEAEDGSGR